jgi:hypothetical protein
METTYTARQAAAALGVGKSTILRAWDKLPPEMTAQGSYRGQPTKLVTRAGIQRLSMLLSVSQVDYAALDEAPRSAPSAQTSESSEAKQGAANQADLIAELRARIDDKERRIAAQDDEIQFLREELKARRRELEARLLLTAAQSAQNEGEPEPPTDTTPSGESAQEAASAPTEAPAPEITRASTQEAPPERASFAERLRFLFTGRN